MAFDFFEETAPWWKFWEPNSGFFGGMVFWGIIATIIAALLKVLGLL